MRTAGAHDERRISSIAIVHIVSDLVKGLTRNRWSVKLTMLRMVPGFASVPGLMYFSRVCL